MKLYMLIFSFLLAGCQSLHREPPPPDPMFEQVKACNQMPITRKTVMAYDNCFRAAVLNSPNMKDSFFSSSALQFLADRREAAVQFSEGKISQLEYGAKLEQSSAKMAVLGQQYKMHQEQMRAAASQSRPQLPQQPQETHCTPDLMGGMNCMGM